MVKSTAVRINCVVLLTGKKLEGEACLAHLVSLVSLTMAGCSEDSSIPSLHAGLAIEG